MVTWRVLCYDLGLREKKSIANIEKYKDLCILQSSGCGFDLLLVHQSYVIWVASCFLGRRQRGRSNASSVGNVDVSDGALATGWNPLEFLQLGEVNQLKTSKHWVHPHRPSCVTSVGWPRQCHSTALICALAMSINDSLLHFEFFYSAKLDIFLPSFM